MKKISFICMAFLAGLGLTACSGDDYEGWADQPSNAQEDAITIDGFSATGVDPIDMANVEGNTVKLYDLNLGELPESYTITSSNIELTPKDADNAISTDANSLSSSIDLISHEGTVTTADLIAAVKAAYGGAPTARSFDGRVLLKATTPNSTNVLINCGTVNVTVTLDAPIISSAYYIIGAPNNWSASDRTYKFNHSSQDVYDDPVFTITIPAATNDDGSVADTWFAIGDDASLDAIVNDNDWSQLLGTTLGNGNNGINVTEPLGVRSAIGNDASFKVAASYGAKYIRVTINMLDQTYLIEPLSFSTYIYEIGNESGWSTGHALYGKDYDGNYLGYYYLNGEFKFKPNADNWDNDWEYNGEGKIADIQNGPNVPDPGAGYYQIKVNTADLTYSLLKVEKISIIGSAVNGDTSWGTEYDLTYNTATDAWEWTGDLTAGEAKFRVNHDWAISWGGTESGTDYDHLTENNGKNLTIAEAGTYKISLTVHQENGDCKVSIVKQ